MRGEEDPPRTGWRLSSSADIPSLRSSGSRLPAAACASAGGTVEAEAVAAVTSSTWLPTQCGSGMFRGVQRRVLRHRTTKTTTTASWARMLLSVGLGAEPIHEDPVAHASIADG